MKINDISERRSPVVKISRDDFIKKSVRIGLIAFLSFLTFFLGTRVVTGRDCSECAGKGICTGEEPDCNVFKGGPAKKTQ